MTTTRSGLPLVMECTGSLGEQMFQYVFGKIILKNLQSHGKLAYELYCDESSISQEYAPSLSQYQKDEEMGVIRRKRELQNALGMREPSGSLFPRLFDRIADVVQFHRRRSAAPFEKLRSLSGSYDEQRSGDSLPFLFIDEKHYGNFEGDALIQGFTQLLRKNAKPVFFRGLWQKGNVIKRYMERFPFLFELMKGGVQFRIMRSKILAKENSVSIRIHKNDYLNPSYGAKTPLCTLSYYLEAIRDIRRRCPNPHFFLFSDDVFWVRRNFVSQILSRIEKFPSTVVVGEKRFFGNEKTLTDYEELFLINDCVHHILTNTANSWWGTGLLAIGRVPDGIVKAPRMWFADVEKSKQIMLPRWEIINK